MHSLFLFLAFSLYILFCAFALIMMSIEAAEPCSAALLPASDSDVHSSAALCWHFLSQSSKTCSPPEFVAAVQALYIATISVL